VIKPLRPANDTGSRPAWAGQRFNHFSQAQRARAKKLFIPGRLAKQILEQQTNAYPQQQGRGLTDRTLPTASAPNGQSHAPPG